MYRFLTSLLNVHPQEAWLVKRLFFIQFFLVLAGAFLFITANTIFISSLPISDLPKAYVLSGIFLLAANYCYRRMDIALDIKKLSYTVLGTSLSLIILLWIAMQLFSGTAIPYILFIIYNIVYMLMGHVFWTLAALLFNTRDSKRIFTLISAGDLPAKIIAYMAVSLVAYLIGLESMVLVTILFLVIAFVLVGQLFNNKKLDILEYEHQQVHYFKKYSFKSRINPLRRIFGSELILSLAAVAFISFVIFLIIDFTFLAEVKPLYKTDVELASFFGMFFALGRIGGIFIKLVFSSRLIKRIGIVKTLLFLPLALLAFCLFIFFVEKTEVGFTRFIYLFGFMTLLAEVGRSVIQEPVFFVLFQPLKLDLRLKGHVIAKGYMYPLAMIVAGGGLYSYLQLQGSVSISTITSFLVAAILVWIVLVFFVRKTYLLTLQEAIKSGFFRGRELYINDDNATQKMLLQKTESHQPGEVIYALGLLERAGYEEMPQLMVKMLGHNEKLIIGYALDWIIAHKPPDCLASLQTLLSSNSDEDIRAKCIYAIGVIAPEQNDYLKNFIQSEQPSLCIAAMTAMLQSSQLDNYQLAADRLLKMTSSDNENERIMAASIIGRSKKKELDQLLLHLLQDRNIQVQLTAIKAAGGLASSEMVSPLVSLLRSRNTMRQARHALISMQETAVNEFPTLHLPNNDPVVKELIRVSSAIIHIGSINFLKQLIASHRAYISDTVRALWQLGFTAGVTDNGLFQKLLKEELQYAIRIADQLSVSEQQANNRNLSRALYWELRNKTYTILYCLSFLYNREKMNEVIFALELKESFKTSNCMELLEVSLPANLFKDINRLLEVVEMNYSLNKHKSQYKNVIEVLQGIISNPPFIYNRWTNAQAIYHSGQHKIQPLISVLRKLPDDETEPIIQETRMFVISRNQ